MHSLLNLRLIVVLFILSGTWASAQQTGEVDYPYLGIKFTIPDGWKGAEQQGAYIMGSDTEAGLILLIPHEEKQISTLKMQAEQGLHEEGISLTKSGEFHKVGAEGIGAEFTGVIQGTAAKAFIAAVINPFGMGVTIMAATDVSHYSNRYKELAEKVALSLKFSQPKESPLNKEWQQALNGAKLTYMESYNSSGPSYGGYSTYGGYSSRIEIVLCPNSQFTYYSTSSMSIDTGGAFGGGGGNTSNAGTWHVSSGAGGTSTLILKFNDGNQSTYELSYNNQKTYLNNTRYFRTYDHGQCN